MTTGVRLAALLAGTFAAHAALAANLVVNPDFTAGLMDWSLASDGGVMTLESLGLPGAPSVRVTGDTAISGAEIQSACIAIDDSAHVDFRFNRFAVAGLAAGSIVAYSDATCSTALDSFGTQPSGPDPDWIGYSLSDVVLPAGTRSARVLLAATPDPHGGRGDALFDHVAFGAAGTLPVGINANQEGLTGAWYNPLFGGQGLQLAISPDSATPGSGSLFGAWYTFDEIAGDTDTQRWYSLEASIGGDGASTDVTIYENTGGNFDAPPTTAATPVGTGRLVFQSCTSASFDYALDDGRIGTLSLQSLLSNVECIETGTPATPPSDFGLSGTWYAPVIGGQGFLVNVNPVDAQVFVGWYTYALDGEGSGVSGQRWFSAQGSYVVGHTTMDLYVYVSTGGTFDSGGSVSTNLIGTATLTFASCSAAQLDFEFSEGEIAGQSGTIELVRLGAAPTSCDLGE